MNLTPAEYYRHTCRIRKDIDIYRNNNLTMPDGSETISICWEVLLFWPDLGYPNGDNAYSQFTRSYPYWVFRACWDISIQMGTENRTAGNLARKNLIFILERLRWTGHQPILHGVGIIIPRNTIWKAKENAIIWAAPLIPVPLVGNESVLPGIITSSLKLHPSAVPIALLKAGC